jgi:hypothetical protein
VARRDTTRMPHAASRAYCFDILLIPVWFDYDSDRVFGHHEVPMLQVFRSFDGSEILIIAAASILVASITFLL